MPSFVSVLCGFRRVSLFDSMGYQTAEALLLSPEVNTSSAAMLQKLDTTQQARHPILRTTSRAMVVVISSIGKQFYDSIFACKVISTGNNRPKFTRSVGTAHMLRTVTLLHAGNSGCYWGRRMRVIAATVAVTP